MSITIEKLEEESKTLGKRILEIEKLKDEVVGEFKALANDVEVTEDDENAFHDVVSDFAYRAGLEWGNPDAYEFGDWQIGDKVVFWQASTC